ncbi:hypothetical protein V6Z11_D07G166000 [Gossypium hirsutum]
MLLSKGHSPHCSPRTFPSTTCFVANEENQHIPTVRNDRSLWSCGPLTLLLNHHNSCHI